MAFPVVDGADKGHGWLWRRDNEQDVKCRPREPLAFPVVDGADKGHGWLWRRDIVTPRGFEPTTVSAGKTAVGMPCSAPRDARGLELVAAAWAVLDDSKRAAVLQVVADGLASLPTVGANVAAGKGADPRAPDSE